MGKINDLYATKIKIDTYNAADAVIGKDFPRTETEIACIFSYIADRIGDKDLIKSFLYRIMEKTKRMLILDDAHLYEYIKDHKAIIELDFETETVSVVDDGDIEATNYALAAACRFVVLFQSEHGREKKEVFDYLFQQFRLKTLLKGIDIMNEEKSGNKHGL